MPLANAGVGRSRAGPARRCGVLIIFSSDPDRIRTYDLQIRNLPLYPAELRGLAFIQA